MMRFPVIYLDVVAEVGAIDPSKISYSLVSAMDNPRVHLTPVDGCTESSGWNKQLDRTSPGREGTYEELRTILEKHDLCRCTPLLDALEALAPHLDAITRSKIHWLTLTRRRRDSEDELDWPIFAILNVPTEPAEPRCDEVVAAELHRLHDEAGTVMSDPELLQLRVDTLRQGEGVLALAATSEKVEAPEDGTRNGHRFVTYVNTVENRSCPAPAGASLADVIAHHDQYRLWVSLDEVDFLDNERPFSHINPLTDDYVHLPNGDMIASLPEAVVAARRMSVATVIGPDHGYRAADVAETIGVFPDTVPLADRIAALAAARI